MMSKQTNVNVTPTYRFQIPLLLLPAGAMLEDDAILLVAVSGRLSMYDVGNKGRCQKSGLDDGVRDWWQDVPVRQSSEWSPTTTMPL